MADITVNSTVMRDKATTLKTIGKSVKTFTDDMMNEMNRLSGVWQGSAAEETVSKFKGLADDFEERFTTINSYADFLMKAADEWDTRENELKGSASSLTS